MKKIKNILCALLVALSPICALAMNTQEPAKPQSLNSVLQQMPEIEQLRRALIENDADTKRELGLLKPYQVTQPRNTVKVLHTAFDFNPQKSPASDREAYAAATDYLSYALMYQHDFMQNALNVLYLLVSDNIARVAGENRPSLADIVVRNVQAREEFEAHRALFENTRPQGFTPEIAQAIEKWRTSDDADIRLLAQILCEACIRDFICANGGKFTTRLNGLVRFNALVMSKLHEVENLEATDRVSHAAIEASCNDTRTLLGRFRAHKQILLKIQALLANYVKQKSINYAELMQDIQKEVLIYTITHEYNERLYSTLRKESEREYSNAAQKNKRLAQEIKGSGFTPTLSGKKMPASLAPLHISEELAHLVRMNNTFNQLVASQKSTCTQVTNTLEASSQNAAQEEDTHTIMPVTLSPEEKAAKAAKRKERRLQNKLARLTAQAEAASSPKPQEALTKAQRKKKNKEAMLDTMAQAIVPASSSPAAAPDLVLMASGKAPRNAFDIVNASGIQLQQAAPTAKKLMPVESDGSYVLDETNKNVVIAGAQNTIITLAKKKIAEKNITPATYAADIKQWRDDPKGMLQKRGHEKPDLKDPAQSRDVTIHSFAKAVDNFIKEHATSCKTKTRPEEYPDGEIALCIPGKIRYASGEEERGFFGYLLDENKKCFHRMFEQGDTSLLGNQLKEHGCFDGYNQF